jgi:DNA adenine methylase
MKTLLNYPGAKWGMAETIISMFPPHRSYLEPYFGSGAVLFNKPPSAIETINDIDGDVVNLFRVIQSNAEELARRVCFTPYARDIFNEAQQARQNNKLSELERAYWFCIRSKMGFGFKTYTHTGFKIDIVGRERSYAVSCWNKLPDLIMDAAIRLKRVQIENRPALDVIRRFHFDNVLIYADPPYLLYTRGGPQYRHEMNEQDHIDLLDALMDHPGPVIISGYDSDLYNQTLKGWSKTTVRRYAQNHESRIECLWCKHCGPITFFSEENA